MNRLRSVRRVEEAATALACWLQKIRAPYGYREKKEVQPG